MLKKKWVLLIFILLLAALMYNYRGHLKTKIAEDKEKKFFVEVKITQVTHSLLSLPLYIAVDRGYFAEEGLNIALQTTWSQEKAVWELLNNDSTILLAGPETAFYLIQQGNSGNPVCFAQTSVTCGCFLVARENNKPFSWQDLKNKVVIGYNDGELSGIIFDYILKSNNLQPLQDVHIITNVPYQAVQGVFQSGTGHYILTPEPWAAKIEKENNGTVVASIDTASAPLVTSAFITTKDYLHTNRDTCNKLIKALYKGLIWVNDNSPEDIVLAIKSYFPDEDEKTLLRAVSRYKNYGCWPLTPLINKNGINKLQEIMLEEKELIEGLPLDRFIDNSLAEEVVNGKSP